MSLQAEDTTEEDFFSLYLEYTKQTECPEFFHRWTAISLLGAWMGRNVHFKFGHFNIHPNLYIMLVGSPGTKKSSAIKIGTGLLKNAGFSAFSAKKTRQEKFLMDMANESDEGGNGEDILDQNLWGDVDVTTLPAAECYVAADEFNNFIGVGNLDFMSLLGELWDYEGVYDHRLKTSKSIKINNPTVNLLGGNTPTNINLCFPAEAVGQGFFSRLIFVHAEPTHIKYTIPPAPDKKAEAKLIELLLKIRANVIGEMTLTDSGLDLLDTIYKTWEDLDDPRFEYYSNRRQTQLLKLCMIVAASRLTTTITDDIVLYANTVLTYTEHYMPKALGEFGRSRRSESAHKILSVLDAATAPMSVHAIWKKVHMDLDSRSQLAEILGDLSVAEKVQVMEGGAYLPRKRVRVHVQNGTVDFSLLGISGLTVI